MINQCTKFEVSRFPRYEARVVVQNAENGVVLGSYGSLRVIRNVTIRYSAYDFLFDFNRNHASIFYRFRDIAGYLSKVADFNPPQLHFVPS